jgi:hypothetical protein
MNGNGGAVWRRGGGARGWMKGLLVGSWLLWPWTGVRAASFRVAEASGTKRLVSEQLREPVASGENVTAPWRAVTEEGGRLLLFGGGIRMEFLGRSDAELAAVSRPLEARQIHTFLKPAPERGILRASDSVFTLAEGTLLAEVGEQPLSVSCPHLLLDARSAVFAMSSSPSEGALLTVLQGQVKVRTMDRSVIYVGAGKCLRVASGIPPRLGLLDDVPGGQEHRRGLLRLSSVEIPGATGLAQETSPAVGTGAEAPFDLSRRRRAALLTAPSPGQIGLPEVSPELPQTPTLKP